MRNKFSRSNNIDKPGYKVEDSCAGLKCKNKPTIILKIRYVNKTGHFCQKCSSKLIRLELAEFVVGNKSSAEETSNVYTDNTSVISRGLTRS